MFCTCPECYLNSIFSHGRRSRLLGLPCESWCCVHSKVWTTISVVISLLQTVISLSTSSGDLELSAKCFQELLLKDQNHPAALVNYAALLLCKYGSLSAGTYTCLPYYSIPIVSYHIINAWLSLCCVTLFKMMTPDNLVHIPYGWRHYINQFSFLFILKISPESCFVLQK